LGGNWRQNLGNKRTESVFGLCVALLYLALLSFALALLCFRFV